MAGFFDFLEDKLLDHVFGAVAYTPPATLYIGLSTTTVTDAGGNITEPSGNGYARVAVANNTTNFPNSSGGAKSNGKPITFPAATGSWGTITDFFIADAATEGNFLTGGALGASQTVAAGETINFAVGALDITLD